MVAAMETSHSDELYALKCIYDDDFEYKILESKDSMFSATGTYEACVDIPENFKVTWKDLRKGTAEMEEMVLQHLPAVTLSFSLPPDYPLTSPPQFVVSCSWLRKNDISKLCVKLQDIWEAKKGEVLFDWALFLKEESLTYLDIVDILDLSILYTSNLKQMNDSLKYNVFDQEIGSAVLVNNNFPPGFGRNNLNKAENKIECNSGDVSLDNRQSNEIFESVLDSDDVRAQYKDPLMPLINMLKDFNKSKCREIFLTKIFRCEICFESFLGSQCSQFEPCDHVFCKRCIKTYFESKIKEGSVKNINCPFYKCQSVATPPQIKDLVSDETFAKYDSLLLKITLDVMEDVLYCPFVGCNTPVIKEPDEKMAQCPFCMYVFCVYCKAAYHGVEPCRFKVNEKQKLVKEYRTASPEHKATMEMQYGKKQLRHLCESVLTDDWMKSNSRNCPRCKAAVEKGDGCNKMTCSHCQINFCWICMNQITTEDPYEHFNAPDSKCAQKLFLGVEEERFEEEEEWFEEEEEWFEEEEEEWEVGGEEWEMGEEDWEVGGG